MTYKVHRRQFVLSSTAFHLPGWRSQELGASVVLSHDPDLKVRSEGETVVLGEALLGDSTGRFVTIAGGELRLDTAGLLAVYYAVTPDGVVATSSPALARRILAAERDTLELRWSGAVRRPSGKLLNWFPSPASSSIGVNRLLPDQALNLSTGEVTRVGRPFEPFDDVEEASRILADQIGEATAALPDGRLCISLTAGLDSRVILAGLVASGRPFDAVTQQIGDSAAAADDIRIARELASRYGARHTVMRPRRTRVELIERRAAHTDGSYVDADDLLVPNGQYGFLQDGVVVVRGGCFEIGRRQLHDIVGDVEFDAAGAAVFAERFGCSRDTHPSAVEALERWAAWRADHPNGLDPADSFFLDQRLGGWFASLEQNLDAYPGRSINPANSYTAFTALLGSRDPDVLRSGEIQKRAAERLCCGILETPLNPSASTRPHDRVRRVLARHASRTIRRLRGVRQFA